MLPRGTGQTFSTHLPVGPRPLISCFHFFFHAAPWHRAEVLDPQLDRSSTDFFLRHLVAQSRSPRHTARLVLDRFFLFLFFFTPPHGTDQKSTTHCSNSPRHHVARQAKRNTTVRQPRTLAEAAHSTPLKGQVRKGANIINNFFGPPTQTAPKHIATLIH